MGSVVKLLVSYGEFCLCALKVMSTGQNVKSQISHLCQTITRMYHRAFWPILHGIPCVAFPEISWAPLWRYLRYIPGTSEVPGVHSGYLWGAPLFLIPVRGQTLQIDTSFIPIESVSSIWNYFPINYTCKSFLQPSVLWAFDKIQFLNIQKYKRNSQKFKEFDILSFPNKNRSLWCTIPSESSKILYICSILNHFNFWIEEKIIIPSHWKICCQD